MQTTINFANLPLEVSGDYVPPARGTRLEPPEPACIERMRIKLGEYDLSDIFTDEKDLEEIEKLALEGMSK